jgi:arylsulfatase A-like enzyme
VREYRQGAPQVYWDTFGALESDLDEAHHSTTWIGDRALDELMTWGEGGHLLMVGFIKPHHPFDPPAPWSDVYDPKALTLLPGWSAECLSRDLAFHQGFFSHEELTERRLRRAMALYYATISQIDHHVGRMIDYLKGKGLYEDALIVYTSDHGDYMGFHHLLLKGNYMYDPLVKIPLVVKYPGRLGAGTRSEALSSNVDLAPTLLRCVGCSAPGSMEGLDLLAHPEGRTRIYAEGWRGGQYMVRTRARKLLLCREGTRSQFFDLEDDPLEFHNRYDDSAYREEREALREALSAWALYDSPSRAYVDYQAPVVGSGNVPRPDDGHVEEGVAYFRQKMGKPVTFSTRGGGHHR